jgi:hypothetical protein
MAREIESLDVSNEPALRRLAEEVRAAGKARVLRSDDTDLAVIVPLPARPAPRQRRRLSKSAKEAFLSAAGGWKDVETDRLLKDIYDARQVEEDRNISL